MEVGWNDQRVCNSPELERTVVLPLTFSSMSEVVTLWKRIVPSCTFVWQWVRVRSGLLEKKEGRCTASLEMASMGVLVCGLTTSVFPRRTGAVGMGPWKARDCEGDSWAGLECGGSGSGWIGGVLGVGLRGGTSVL